MTATRPTAVGYTSAPTDRARRRQLAMIETHAEREGMALADVVHDHPERVTLSELGDVAARHAAQWILLPPAVGLADRPSRVPEKLEHIDAACVVVTDPDAWMLALDIDGTLTGEGERDVPEESASAVLAAHEAGHHLVLATGRSLVGALPVAAALGLDDGWIVASNGALTARIDPTAPGGYRIEDAQTLDPERVVRLARDLEPAVRVGVEEIGWGYRVTERFADHEVNGRQRVVDDDAELWDMPSPRVILAAPAAAPRLAGAVTMAGLTANIANAGWVDVTPTDLSKATALEKIRQRLAVPRTQTLAIDDGTNGIPMLRWAHRGVAMGHAGAQVREAADEVTGTLAEHGAAAAIRSLLTALVPASR
ncbi:HAD family hydrolase [Antribacter gilvus]|uniref:HAD family hydrolase n=1 Tax=Antribacter gilvus TaxID=2304675 RepID=UPI000F76C379|nr:HAD family hydrolase [Antribacter gilvus]